jgi:hypothetical protein
MRRLTNLLTIALILFLCGCTPWGTYPAIEGAAGLSDPELAPIPMLMAEAVRFVHERDGGEGKLLVNLPPDTPAKVYDKVFDKLGGGEPLLEPDPKAYHVHIVRIRATDAEVDVIHPGPGDVPQLTTVKFRQNVVKGWYVKEHRDWRLRVDVPEPNYVPSPVKDESNRVVEPAEESETAGG